MANVIAITDDKGNVIARREYNAFGEVIAQTGDWPSRFGFHSNWVELGEGLYLTPTRIYDSKTGRFIQPDRNAKAGENRYIAFKNNPKMYVDPDGRAEVPQVPIQTDPSQTGQAEPEIPTVGEGEENNKFDLYALLAELRKHEDCKFCRYLDHRNNWTIGIGHKLIFPDDPRLKEVIPDENRRKAIINSNAKMLQPECVKLFLLDVKKAIEDAKAVVSNFDELAPMAQQICVEMAYQMGRQGLANHVDMIAALNNKDYEKAAGEIIKSRRWEDPQTKPRAQDQANRMKNIAVSQEQRQPEPSHNPTPPTTNPARP